MDTTGGELPETYSESFEKARLVFVLLASAGVGGDDRKQQQRDTFEHRRHDESMAKTEEEPHENSSDLHHIWLQHRETGIKSLRPLMILVY